jgi:hypothetical protein
MTKSIGSVVGLSTGIARADTPDQSAGSPVGRITSCGQLANSKSTRAEMPPALTRAPVTSEMRALATEMRAASAGLPKRMICVTSGSVPQP